jgi:TPR repeat protein
MFGNGDSVAQEEAVRWYRLAAAQGYAGAQCNLGLMLYRSFGVVAQDKAKALRWWLLAAAHGHELAQIKLKQLGVGSALHTAPSSSRFDMPCSIKQFVIAVCSSAVVYYSVVGPPAAVL